MNKIEHIGIAVKNMEESVLSFSKLLNCQPYKTEVVESEGVTTVFFQVGETKIELLEAHSRESPIGRFIDKKGEGIHHIAFAVDNTDQEINRLKNIGFELINEEAKPGADNKMIAFAHPKSTGGVLVEICSEKTEAS